ncbi:MAG: indole-3-glycerol phosphate synthase TrpC [Deltaproteobacteria bacterium]|nr:indole-3-glycerol phosphate synthase TrpC [Deltaproteobacteria bacterium]MBI3389588.1 indole-3-glycerol phosphate synthase TrpC [Deltaproteobacteria bacterium]
MILDDILANKREEVSARKRAVSLAALRERPLYREARRGFVAAVSEPGAIIAEVKKASPSKGLIRSDFDPLAIACAYATHGAAAVSVLTDERFFQGRLDYLAMIRAAVTLPLIEKDFVVDPYQITEARAYGADAILLIVAALRPEQLMSLAAEAEMIGVDALVEVHNEAELDLALSVRPRLLGMNNRDLHTFVTSLATCERLLPRVPAGCTVVAESGIETRADIERLLRAGAHAFLIGETFMRAPDPGVKLDELRGVTG